MAKQVRWELNAILDRIDELGKTASALITKDGVNASDIQLAVKRKFGVKITNSTARKIMAAILLVW